MASRYGLVSILGRKKREEDLERGLIELRERCNLLEKKLEETVEKTQNLEKGARLLTEAVYKIITYLKDFEWPKEEARQEIEDRPLEIVRKKEASAEEYLTETEKKLVDEIKKRGTLAVGECYTHIGRSKEHVSRMLKRLVEKGILVRERKGKTFYYRFAGE